MWFTVFISNKELPSAAAEGSLVCRAAKEGGPGGDIQIYFQSVIGCLSLLVFTRMATP